MAKEAEERKKRLKEKRKADLLKGNPFNLHTRVRADTKKRPP